MSATEAVRTRVHQQIVDRFDAHGARAGNYHWYSKLACSHLVDHGPVDKVDKARLKPLGAVVCCRQCTNKARGRSR